jgi:hypothetical protein
MFETIYEPHKYLYRIAWPSQSIAGKYRARLSFIPLFIVTCFVAAFAFR